MTDGMQSSVQPVLCMKCIRAYNIHNVFVLNMSLWQLVVQAARAYFNPKVFGRSRSDCIRPVRVVLFCSIEA